MSEKMKTVKVKLVKPHTHKGMKYDMGFELELPEHDATWLKNLKIAEDVKTSAPVSAKAAEEK